MTCESVACRSYFTNKSVRDVCALRDLWYLWAMCVRASMKAAKPLHIVLATNPNPTRARGYPLNINPKPDPKPDSISGPAGSGRVADLYQRLGLIRFTHLMIRFTILISRFNYIHNIIWTKWDLKVTYHENRTFPGFKCYNQVPSVSTNQGNVKKINPVTLFWSAFFCKHLKKMSASDLPPLVMLHLIIILPLLNL